MRTRDLAVVVLLAGGLFVARNDEVSPPTPSPGEQAAPVVDEAEG